MSVSNNRAKKTQLSSLDHKAELLFHGQHVDLQGMDISKIDYLIHEFEDIQNNKYRI